MNPNLSANPRPHRGIRGLLEGLEPRDTPTFVTQPPDTITPPINGVNVFAAGDFNADSKADLAVGYQDFSGSGGEGVVILLGKGDGTFQTGQTLPVPAGALPNAITAFQANPTADATTDLAVALSLSQSGPGLQVFLGNGNGTFQVPPSFQDNNPAQAVASADFNKDARPDLVTITGGNFQVFLGNGAGGYTSTGPQPSPPSLPLIGTRLVTADFDKDGNQDFAALDAGNELVVYYGDGAGGFTPVATSLTGGFGSEFVAGDFDGDGDTDVVVAQNSAAVFHANQGPGTRAFDPAGSIAIAPGPFSGGLRLAATDFNGDGIADIVATDPLADALVAYGGPGGNFTPDTGNPYTTFPGSETGTDDLTTGDFDGDLNQDFAVLGQPITGAVQVFLNQAPDFTQTAVTTAPNPSDVDEAVTFTATVTPLGTATGPAGGTVTFTITGPVNRTLGPVTLAGGTAQATVSDLPVGDYTVVAVYSGNGAFRPSTSPPAAHEVESEPVYLAGSDNGAVICVFLPDAYGQHGAATFGSSFTGVRPFAADVTGDGIADQIAGSGVGGPSRVSVIDGKTGTVVRSFSPFGNGFTGGVLVSAGDIDGDGVADLAVSADMGGGPRVQVYLSRPTGFMPVADFLGIEDGNFRGGARVALGDVNRDGYADLVVAAGPGGGPRIATFDGKLLATGQVTRLWSDFFAFDPGSRIGAFVAAGDVNRDGFADIVIGADDGGGPRVLVFDGASLVAGKRQVMADFFAGPATDRGGIRVAARDVNDDGFAELITGSGVGNGSRVRVFSGQAVAAGNPGSPIKELDAFPGLTAGIYVG